MGTFSASSLATGPREPGLDDVPTGVFKSSDLDEARARQRTRDRCPQGSRGTKTPLRPAAPSAIRTREHASLVVQSGPDRGLVVRLDRGAVVVGRDALSDLWADDPGVSRRHARIGLGLGGAYFIEDLGSTNGTFVAGTLVTIAPLAPGDLVQLGESFMFEFVVASAEEEALRRDLFESAIRDPLTGAYNRRYFAERLAAEVSRARHTDDELSVCIFDCDHFRAINNVHGHLAGDKVLVELAKRMSTSAPSHALARYGGEEFVLLAPMTSRAAAAELAEHIRRDVERLSVGTDAGRVSVTVSGGVASLAELSPTDAPMALIALADQRLYDAKHRGRNRIEAVPSE